MMPIFEPVFLALNEAGVRYVVVGGLVRPQDLADIEALEALKKRGTKRDSGV